MKKITFNTGIEEFEINGGKILRFNPADINVYKRLIDAQEKIVGVETSMVEKAAASGDNLSGETIIGMLAEADAKIKEILGEIFGSGNDFHEIFEGVNVMAVAENGERVITNFLAAITPILEKGAQKAARAQASADATAIKGNRAQRRAKK